MLKELSTSMDDNQTKMAIKKNVCGLNIVSDTNRLSDYSNFYFSFNGNPKYVEVCRCKEFLTRKYWIAVIVFLRISLDPRLDRSIRHYRNSSEHCKTRILHSVGNVF